MTDTVVIALPRFRKEAERIGVFLGAEVRDYTLEIFPELFPEARRIVAVMSMGIVVRRIAPLLTDKWNDPAIVVVSPDMRYAVPLLGGHHGANSLAKELAGLGLCPVITTATEATGPRFCRRDRGAGRVLRPQPGLYLGGECGPAGCRCPVPCRRRARDCHRRLPVCLSF